VHTPETLVLYRIHPENQISECDVGKRLVDRARAWAVLDGHRAARTDLAPSIQRAFARRKYEVARGVMPWDAPHSASLSNDVPALLTATHPLWRIARRIEARLRVAVSGNPYPWTFAAGPLRADQKREIARLGYDLP
jgi:hypothetical protein